MHREMLRGCGVRRKVLVMRKIGEYFGCYTQLSKGPLLLYSTIKRTSMPVRIQRRQRFRAGLLDPFTGVLVICPLFRGLGFEL